MELPFHWGPVCCPHHRARLRSALSYTGAGTEPWGTEEAWGVGSCPGTGRWLGGAEQGLPLSAPPPQSPQQAGHTSHTQPAWSMALGAPLQTLTTQLPGLARPGVLV